MRSHVDSPSLAKPALDLSHPLLRPLLRLMPELSYYTIVSAVALTADLSVFAALTRGGMQAAAAGIIGYAVGLVLHYFLSVRFVFGPSTVAKSGLRRFVEFVLAGVIGLAITWLIIAVSTELLHLPALLGKVAAVGISFIVVFMLRKGIVFAGRSR